MIRRRRPSREIAFSFDSFLDVVANVVGIVLRLILVAWVGARSYKAYVEVPPPPPVPAPAPAPALPPLPTFPELVNPLAPVLARRRQDLAGARAALSAQEGRIVEARRGRQGVARAWNDLAARRLRLEAERLVLEGKAQQEGLAERAAALSLKALQARSKKLLADLDAIGKVQGPKKELRYRVPLSQPVTEELMFECRAGRVTLLDVGALTQKILEQVRSRAEELTTRWAIDGVTPPVGAFKLRWQAERQRTMLDGASAVPAGGQQFTYGLTAWVAEPISLARGETEPEALSPRGQFRKVIAGLSPQTTAVTFWVYPDSFALYRSLRDRLHDLGFVVAGRPLPDGVFITSSRRGTASRGQ